MRCSILSWKNRGTSGITQHSLIQLSHGELAGTLAGASKIRSKMRMAYSDRRTRILTGLTYAALALFVVAMLMDLFYVGPERQQGEALRVFYVQLVPILRPLSAFGTGGGAG